MNVVHCSYSDRIDFQEVVFSFKGAYQKVIRVVFLNLWEILRYNSLRMVFSHIGEFKYSSEEGL